MLGRLLTVPVALTPFTHAPFTHVQGTATYTISAGKRALGDAK